MAKSAKINLEERYITAIEMLEKFKQKPKMEDPVAYKIIKNNLAQALLFGKTEACEKLAELNEKGHGGVKSAANYKLFVYIGYKLGDVECYNIFKKLEKLVSFKSYEREAEIWLNFIKANIREYSKGVTVTQENINKIQKELKEELKQQNINLNAYIANFNDDEEKAKIVSNSLNNFNSCGDGDDEYEMIELGRNKNSNDDCGTEWTLIS